MAGSNPNPNPKKPPQSKMEKAADSIGAKVADQVIRGVSAEFDDLVRRKQADAAELERRRTAEDAENARIRQEAEARRQADAERERARVAAIELERNALRDQQESSRRFWRNFWLIITGLILIALIASLITFLVMRDPTPTTMPANPDPVVLIDSCCPPNVICDTPCPPAPSGGGSSRVNVKVIPERDLTKAEEEAIAGALDYCDSQTDLSADERRACMEKAFSL